MIAAQVVRVAEEHDLETGDTVFRLGVRLPTGDVVYAEASSEVMKRLQSLGARKVDPPQPRQPSREEPKEPEALPEGYEPAPEVDEYATGSDLEASGDEEVEWEKLPDTLLPEHVKKAMSEIKVGDQGMPSTLQLSQVVQIRDSILDEYTASDWERLGFVPEAHVQRPGAIQWAEGGTQQPRTVPQRRVSNVDEKGNPIVRRNPRDVDPGEIAAADDDDTEQF